MSVLKQWTVTSYDSALTQAEVVTSFDSSLTKDSIACFNNLCQ